MKIKAKFKGSNSLGYENGVNYDLWFETETEGPRDFIWIKHITQHSGGSMTFRMSSVCEYNSLKAFLNNWQVF